MGDITIQAKLRNWAQGYGTAYPAERTVPDTVFRDALKEILRLDAVEFHLRVRIAELEESRMMSCVEPNPSCQCSGCLYAREKSVEANE